MSMGTRGLSVDQPTVPLELGNNWMILSRLKPVFV